MKPIARQRMMTRGGGLGLLRRLCRCMNRKRHIHGFGNMRRSGNVYGLSLNVQERETAAVLHVVSCSCCCYREDNSACSRSHNRSVCTAILGLASRAEAGRLHLFLHCLTSHDNTQQAASTCHRCLPCHVCAVSAAEEEMTMMCILRSITTGALT